MERLQRILAARGVSSRRAAEELIRAGRVRVDGQVVTELGTKADPIRAEIRVDGKLLKTQRPRYLLLNKPRGYITTVKDERDRRTVMDLIEIPERVYPVGRLDRDTEGLLLLTNDGDVANRVMHPRYGLDKEYQVLTLSRPTDTTLQRLRKGVTIDGKRIVPEEVRIVRETNEGLILKIVVHEGINHLVRRMMEEVGIPLERLRRVRVGPLSVAGIQLGTWREMTQGELATLLEALKLDQVDGREEHSRGVRFTATPVRGELERGGYGPRAPRRQRDEGSDDPTNERRPYRPAAGDALRVPRGDRFAQQRYEKRERNRLRAEPEQSPEQTRSAPVSRPPFGERPARRGGDDRFDRVADRGRGFPRSNRQEAEADVPSGRERTNERRGFSDRGGPRQFDRRDRPAPNQGAGPDQQRTPRGREEDTGERGERGPERNLPLTENRGRGPFNARRERGNERAQQRRSGDGRGPAREQDRVQTEQRNDRNERDRHGQSDRRFDRGRDDERRGAPDRAQYRERSDEQARGPRAPRRQWTGETPRHDESPWNDDRLNQRGATDDRNRETPPGDRDRRPGSGGQDDRRPRPRRPARRDLP